MTVDPRAVPTTTVEQLRAGFSFFRAGVHTVVTRPILWPYVFVPALITLTALVLGFTTALTVIEWLVGETFTPGPGATALWTTLLFISRWALRLVLFVVFALGAYMAAGLVAVPFNDRLSSEIENEVLGPYDEPTSWAVMLGDLFMSLRHTALGLILWALCMSVLFLLNLLPGIGSIVGTVASVGISSLLLARETMDGSMSRRRLGFFHKLRVVRANLWVCVGLGIGVWVVMWIPLMNFLVLPMAVVGGTRMFCWLEHHERVPNAEGTGPLQVERHTPTARQLSDDA